MSVADTVVLLAGRYRLDQPVASGGFGEVWQGTDVLLARPIAVKLHPELAADAEALAQFRDSARRTGSVAHEGLARIYHYIEASSGMRQNNHQRLTSQPRSWGWLRPAWQPSSGSRRRVPGGDG